jgi:hypothetical protein
MDVTRSDQWNLKPLRLLWGLNGGGPNGMDPHDFGLCLIEAARGAFRNSIGYIGGNEIRFHIDKLGIWKKSSEMI